MQHAAQFLIQSSTALSLQIIPKPFLSHPGLQTAVKHMRLGPLSSTVIVDACIHVKHEVKDKMTTKLLNGGCPNTRDAICDVAISKVSLPHCCSLPAHLHPA
jgi:hypothetical protein